MMASFSQAVLSSNNRNLLVVFSSSSNSNSILKTTTRRKQHTNINIVRVRASNSQEAEEEEEDCNEEECAPDKEVGKVSMEWLAGDKTRVTGTFPPKKRGWTGYVEKDTAGQTNIYPVEPAVYIAESAISSGTAGSSSEGAENTAAVAAGIALISIALASSVLLQLGRKTSSLPEIQTLEQQYSGPSLSYYIAKFKPAPPPPPPPAQPQQQILQDPQQQQQPQLLLAPQLSTPQLEDVDGSSSSTLP